MKVTRAAGARKALKAERRVKGYTLKELVDKLSKLYEIPPGRTFRREVALALRRGVDYGILVKSQNKYRFDPETNLSNSLRCAARRRRRAVKSTPRASKSTARVVRKHMGSRETKAESKEPKGDPPSVPRPTVPPPPNFTPKPRNLNTEPFNKIIKHRAESE